VFLKTTIFCNAAQIFPKETVKGQKQRKERTLDDIMKLYQITNLSNYRVAYEMVSEREDERFLEDYCDCLESYDVKCLAQNLDIDELRKAVNIAAGNVALIW
jgi:hypothetical protein